ncbi:type 2 DNA topoisomerase 6 subunit B-like [Latimeria chalumnae]|uniref:type 2 DNA topoisomerase 6 subunit B-like n=1 Tax=Latimeria chalumnae TaxID=7897 RepID=UPI00313E3F6C
MASSLDFKDQLDCRVTTASAGRWSSNVQREELRKEIESMLGDISIPVTEAWEETDIFIDNLGPLRFQVTFQVCDKSSVLRKDCLVVGQFLHRIGVVHPQVIRCPPCRCTLNLAFWFLCFFFPATYFRGRSKLLTLLTSVHAGLLFLCFYVLFSSCQRVQRPYSRPRWHRQRAVR